MFHLSIFKDHIFIATLFVQYLAGNLFQFSGSLALRSEQALTRLHHITASEQTSNYILSAV